MRWTGTIGAVGGIRRPVEDAHPVSIDALSAIDRALNDAILFTDDLPMHGLTLLVGLELFERAFFDLVAQLVTIGHRAVDCLARLLALPLSSGIEAVKVAADAAGNAQSQPPGGQIPAADHAIISTGSSGQCPNRIIGE